MQTRSTRSALAACALGASLLGATTAVASPASVDLRIEGRNGTIFEGPVTTDAKTVTPSSGDNRRCDGTNGGGNPPGSPGPTPTTALDDGARVGNFTWDGTYDSGFNDYLVNRIGPESSGSSDYWGLFVNYESSSVGGCQRVVTPRDEVLWSRIGFSTSTALKLTGPASGTTGRPVTVRVTDGANGQPLSGATVGGAATGADGNAQLSYSEPGIYRLKAERPESVRSNGLSVCVDPPGADPCTSTDKAGPGVNVRLPGKLASARGRSRTVLVDWLGNDGEGGSGVTGYKLEVSEVSDGFAGAAQSGFRTLVERTPLTRFHFRGDAGSTYRFRVTAIDRATNRGAAESGLLSIPIDDRRLRLSRGWKRVKIARAWGQRSVRSARKGATARLGFRGQRVSLIGRKLARGGRARVTVDGRSKIVGLRGKGRLRSVLFTSRRLPPGRHVVTVRSLGKAPIELDAVAPQP